jgi:hypothetical protein
VRARSARRLVPEIGIGRWRPRANVGFRLGIVATKVRLAAGERREA